MKFNVEEVRKWITIKLGKKVANEIVEEQETIVYKMDEDKLLKVLADNDMDLEVLKPYITVSTSKPFIRGYVKKGD